MSSESPKNWGPYTIRLNDNGNVKGKVPEVSGVRPGDTVTYVLSPSKSAAWCFAGYKSSMPGIITNSELPTDRSLKLTMGVGAADELVDVTLLYYLDISNMTIPFGRPLPDNWPSLVVRSNDPVIKFK